MFTIPKKKKKKKIVGKIVKINKLPIEFKGFKFYNNLESIH
jgi:hypothetical protein